MKAKILFIVALLLTMVQGAQAQHDVTRDATMSEGWSITPMEKKDIEIMRKMTEQYCRKKSETIIVVTLMDDTEQDAVVNEYRSRGYKLKNVALFGEAGINVGKYLIFDVALKSLDK